MVFMIFQSAPLGGFFLPETRKAHTRAPLWKAPTKAPLQDARKAAPIRACLGVRILQKGVSPPFEASWSVFPERLVAAKRYANSFCKEHGCLKQCVNQYSRPNRQ